MSIENQPLDPRDPAQCEAALQTATELADAERAKVASADQALTEAEGALESAVAAFKGKPTVTLGTARMVAEQVRDNCKDTLAGAKAAAAPILQAETAARNRLRGAVAYVEAATHGADIANSIARILEIESALRSEVGALQARSDRQVILIRDLQSTDAAQYISSTLGIVCCDEQTLRQRVREALRRKYPESHFTSTGIHTWISV